tara:strand:- start:280 stop:465 length:186 start_codon:yes stop_codon:yes gene_type:complete
MIFNFNTIIFPIYGFMLGANYWNSEMNEDFDENDLINETEHCLQFMFLFVGISFVWYKEKN